MSYVLVLVGLVATLQSLAWLAGAAPDRMHLRAKVGMLLAPLGLVLFGLGLLGALIPGFWG